jgi:EAL and modified HD-GYP domain-containing signal transduction protein
MSGLRLVNPKQREDLDLHAIHELIRHDASFSYSLLKYVNSAAFHWAARVDSTRHALALVGSDEIRKWVWMASLSSLGERRSPVLMEQVLIRGRFCEVIAASAKLPLGDSDPFLLGMFSLLDAILQRPLQGILDDLSVGRNIRNALLDTADQEDDPLSLVLRIVKAYEIADWQAVSAAAQVIGLSPDALSTCYLQALSWVEAVLVRDESGNKPYRPSAPVGLRRDRETSHVRRH